MYSSDLLEILTTDFPESKKIDEGFLDITGQPFKEVIISRIYAYFLNYKKNTQIAKLFLNALTELIYERSGKELQFEDFVCVTEQLTGRHNRIDLFITSEMDKKCIIVENKVFHTLNNDLLDYWSINDYEDCNKVGILLTLRTQHIQQSLKEKFINITHKDWIERIKSKGLPIELKANEFIYLTDFIRHMEKITENSGMTEEAKFFFDHPGKVLKAIKTYDEAHNYVIAQLRLVAEKMDWELYGNSEDWRHIWDAKNKAQIYYAIEIYKVFDSQPEINIIIEMYKEARGKEHQFRSKLASNSQYTQLSNENRGGPGWLHFANKWYKLTPSDIRDLSGFILRQIEKDFKQVMSILLEELSIKQKNT